MCPRRLPRVERPDSIKSNRPFRQGLRPAGLGGSRRPLPSGVRSDDSASARSWRLVTDRVRRRSSGHRREARGGARSERALDQRRCKVSCAHGRVKEPSANGKDSASATNRWTECEITEAGTPDDRTCHHSARCRRCVALSLEWARLGPVPNSISTTRRGRTLALRRGSDEMGIGPRLVIQPRKHRRS